MKDKVLCLVITEQVISNEKEGIWEQGNWIDTDPWVGKRKKPKTQERVIALIDHLHNDKENGQPLPHYHVDDRYTNPFPKLRIYPDLLANNEKLEYRFLKRKSKHVVTGTPVHMIAKSKLKHKCIHKGKCPHRGFDLTNTIPSEDGIITCPLHGLKFKNKQLIDF